MAQITLNSTGIGSSGNLAFQSPATTARITADSNGRLGFGTQGTTADRLMDMSFQGATTTGTSQFGMVFNPTFPTTPTVNLYNLYTGPNLTSGTTVTNVYGLYLEAISAPSSTVTNRWGLYQAGSSDHNYFNGQVRVGTSTSIDSGKFVLSYASGVNNGLIFSTDGTGSQYATIFRNGNGTVGSITTNGSATAYNTSSDYRLKNTIAPITGALDRVILLKPCTYKWNIDGSTGEGFIAHELADVVPQAVTGEKDGTKVEEYEITPAIEATFDENGNKLTAKVEAVMGERTVPSYQGIDVSFLVATLTAAIQELNAKFEAYKASHS